MFLDFINGPVADGAGFGWHPHSGIATLTYALNADVDYEDTAGQQGLVKATGLEWMRAGGGTWHQGRIHPHGPTVTSFQLWLALPQELENGPDQGITVAPEAVPQLDNVRVLLGRYGESSNPIPAPSPVLYLDVVLAEGETLTFQPPLGHKRSRTPLPFEGIDLVRIKEVGAEALAQGSDLRQFLVHGCGGSAEASLQADDRLVVEAAPVSFGGGAEPGVEVVRQVLEGEGLGHGNP